MGFEMLEKTKGIHARILGETELNNMHPLTWKLRKYETRTQP
jgi:hypothetical protein